MEDILSSQMREGDDFYKLLGCDELSSTDQINTEFKVKARNIHPDKNPDDPTATERFAELQRARDILTDDKRRREYDYWRRSGLVIPYDSWMAMKDAMHTSMHWAVKKKKEFMLEEDPRRSPESHGNRPGLSETDALSRSTPPSNYAHSRPPVPGWTREPASDILQKFRSYNI